MRRLVVLLGLCVAAATLSAAGCNDGTDFRGLGLDSPSTTGGKVSAEAQPSTCGSDPDQAPDDKLDPATLPACAPACAAAHCVPSSKVPAVSRPFFSSCSGGYCLPDTLIASGGAKPPSCKSLGGAAGVCLGLCVPQVAENKDVLPQATCAEDERCAPCVNPNDNKETGACVIGQQTSAGACQPDAGAGAAAPGPEPTADLTCPHVGPPVVDPMPLPPCGDPGSGAHCLPANATPPNMVANLTACGGGFCVPDKLITSGGRFIPTTCASIGGAEGRCQSTALPLVSAQAATLPVAGCDANERCVPCSSPVDGSDTGACRTSCDPGPKTAPVTFSNCCQARGKCVPRASIPSQLTSSLQGDSCSGDALCVPTENLGAGFVPPACRGSGFLSGSYSGVCLSDCLQFGFASQFSLSQGNCPALHTCVPCQNGGQSTGAPGCSP